MSAARGRSGGGLFGFVVGAGVGLAAGYLLWARAEPAPVDPPSPPVVEDTPRSAEDASRSVAETRDVGTAQAGTDAAGSTDQGVVEEAAQAAGAERAEREIMAQPLPPERDEATQRVPPDPAPRLPDTPPAPPPATEAPVSSSPTARTDRIRETFVDARPEFRECYELLLQLEPSASDRLVFELQVTVNPEDYRLAEVELMGIESGSLVVEDLACFAEVAARLDLEPPAAGEGAYTVRYPLVVTPE